ncbi:hypothetical protein [Paenibacillus silvae]|uniref:hypothetical protein n=1 Tax=Paenibacillus silvae TaxID=1325358 RepID=UPI00119E9B6E|nr:MULTISPECIES: hypothetical protein [Paenibacillus]MCK6078132.1 hypothetical protein [Paenibacillus silvae]MCK6152474.1 hypothetical protein [Paenibacillus silvae]MCK6271130.1 hypothetical protein [Paenibacillus silvae]
MNKTGLAVAACMLFAATAASASAATEPMHKMEKSMHHAEHKVHMKAKHEEHKMHMKAKKEEHKLHKNAVSGEHKLRAKSVKPHALPKSGYGGVSE